MRERQRVCLIFILILFPFHDSLWEFLVNNSHMIRVIFFLSIIQLKNSNYAFHVRWVKVALRASGLKQAASLWKLACLENQSQKN